jgi:two-component system LytT family sensor kinase
MSPSLVTLSYKAEIATVCYLTTIIKVDMKHYWKYIFPILFGGTVYTTVRLVNDTTDGGKFWERKWQTNAAEIICVIVVSYLLQFVLNTFIKKFNEEQEGPISRKLILKELITVFIACSIIINVTVIPLVAFTDDGLQLNDFIICNIIPELYVLLYFAIVRGNNYLNAYVNQRLKLEKISNDQLQTELKFLKAQYHPHFLFNALNTIYFQMDENVQEAKKSIEKFSELLRYQLYDQQQTVPISQEIHYLQNFIELQKIRSSEKLQSAVDFDPKLNGQHVYPLLFLPLVENAFKYVGGDYRLSITARQEANNIIFNVVNSIPVTISSTKEGGLGLENLKRRLELLYPKQHTLHIEKTENAFTADLKIQLL